MNEMPVVSIGVTRVYSELDVQLVIKTVYKLSERANEKMEALIKKLEVVRDIPESTVLEIESQINALILAWQTKIEKLGGTPRGVWFADFDSGEGYYCWKFPEAKVEHWHAYQDGYSKRIPLKEKSNRSTFSEKIRQSFLHP